VARLAGPLWFSLEWLPSSLESHALEGRLQWPLEFPFGSGLQFGPLVQVRREPWFQLGSKQQRPFSLEQQRPFPVQQRRPFPLEFGRAPDAVGRCTEGAFSPPRSLADMRCQTPVVPHVARRWSRSRIKRGRVTV
jgi:hypothetical protein